MTEHRLTDTPVLKPCPFCGGHATKVHHYFANRKGDDGEFKHVVRFHGMCTECGATGATKDTLHEQHAESRAVAAWNSRAIEAELSAPDTVRMSLAHLGAWVLAQTRGDYIGSDLNGGDVQDKAEALGLLRRVEVTAPCRENCWCAEYYDSAEWPVECLRYADGVSAMIAAVPKE